MDSKDVEKFKKKKEETEEETAKQSAICLTTLYDVSQTNGKSLSVQRRGSRYFKRIESEKQQHLK